MGQKVHPKGFRVGVIDTWTSRWFAGKEAARFIGEDIKIRKYVKQKLQTAAISKIEIERAASRLKVNIFSAKPGLVIGKKGKDIDELRTKLKNLVKKEVSLNIIETRKADMNAQLLAENIAFQLERRVNFRRAAKDAVQRATRIGAEGVKVSVSGRLNGAEIARTEQYKDGRVPLHTLRADIDYGTAEANTTYGIIGVKTWIFKGEKFSPGKPKYRKQMKRIRHLTGVESRGCKLAFGDYGLRSVEAGWVDSRQIEAGRVAITRKAKRGGKLWIRLFPDKPLTSKPAEVRMGKGKGAPEKWVAEIRPGRIMYEITGVDEKTAVKALTLAMAKMPLRCKIVKRSDYLI
ncbi:UNVERIFIED_CONTAM: hypothetical protein GTU68_056323 [Idotea baltica]|nr:hypothetical protein [Idotea baltica]